MGGFEVVLAHAAGTMPFHHQIMILMPVLPLLLIGSVALVNALDARAVFAGRAPVVGLRVPLTVIAAGLSLGSAAIHFSVVESHFRVFVPYGYAFVALAWFQAIWAQVYVLRPLMRVALTGAVVNAGVVTVWLVSRAIGLPLGPQAGIPQPVGFLDLLATSFEVALIGVLVAVLRPGWARNFALREIPAQKAFVLATFSIATVIVMTIVGLAISTEGAVASL